MSDLKEVIERVLMRAGPMENRDATRNELLDAIADNFVILADANTRPATISLMRSRIKRLEQQLETERSMRPQWAQGFTSDSIAAQSTSTAMHALWNLLGATNQTQAMERLRRLIEIAEEAAK